MRSNIVTEAGLGTQLNSWWGSMTWTTAAVTVACSAIYVLQLLVGFDSFGAVCLAPALLVGRLQLWRAWSSVLFHGSILHLVFNMLAYASMGPRLERHVGTVGFLYLQLLFAATNAAVGAAAAYAAGLAYPPLLQECAIGYSGVLFALILIEGRLAGAASRSIFGFFSIPTVWYPWALMLLLYFMVPGSSLLGHLSGIVSGLAYNRGLLNAFMLPPSFVGAVERLSILAPLVQRPGFIVGGSMAPSSLPTSVSPAADSQSSREGLLAPLVSAWQGVTSYVPQRAAAPPPPQSADGTSDPRFPGQGHTLGAPSGPREGSSQVTRGSATPATHGAPAAVPSPAAAAAAAAAARRAGGVSTKQAPKQASAEGSLKVEDEALKTLMDMGFDQHAGRAALVAAGGDLVLALDLLNAG